MASDEKKIEAATESTSSEQQLSPIPPDPDHQLTGWRLYVTVASGFVGFFLGLLDTTIVAVALPTIADHFKEYDRSTWVINAYLLTYMSFSIVISRLSDIFSPKAVEIACFGIFIAFSLACALSKTITQLIVFRAIQGIGGCGMYSMCMVMMFTLIPVERRSMVAAYASSAQVASGILGPVLGGAITVSRTSNTWPWIFWINLPIAGLALIALLVSWRTNDTRKTLKWSAFTSIDFFGSILLLAASVLLVFALQEAGSYAFAWNSGTIIASLVVSGVCFVAFVLWQYWLAQRPKWPMKIVFPVNLLTRRVIAGAMLSMLLSGFTYYIAVVNIPQRFQIVSGSSPILAGVRLLPLLVSSALGSLIVGALNSKRNVTCYTLVAAAAFQVLGYGLMTTLGNTRAIPARQYGFQIFLGLGFGMSIVSVTRMMDLQAGRQWLAVTQGGLAQVRSLGGSIGLAIAVVVLNQEVKRSTELRQTLTESQESSLLRSPLIVETFTDYQKVLVSTVFADAFTEQMRVATYIAAACFVVSLLTLQRHPPQEERPPGNPSSETLQKKAEAA